MRALLSHNPTIENKTAGAHPFENVNHEWIIETDGIP